VFVACCSESKSKEKEQVNRTCGDEIVTAYGCRSSVQFGSAPILSEPEPEPQESFIQSQFDLNT